MPQPRPDASLKAARQVRKEFRQETWDGFWLTAVEERPVNVVAKELAKDCGAVCTAQPRHAANPGESDRVRAGNVGRRVSDFAGRCV